MPLIRKRLDLDKIEYFETHLSLLNSILPVKMTPMEISVLANFMAIEGAVSQYPFSTAGRKQVMTNLKLSPAGLSNYIKSLTVKRFIKEVEGIITIWPLLIPEKDEQEYQFKLVKNVNTTV